MEIVCARTPEDIRDLRVLMRGLAAHFSTLDTGECPPDAFDGELEGETALYREPEGRMLLAREGAVPVGCAMLRALPDGACEVRRVFVSEDARRRGVARALMLRMMEEARVAGYACMRLVTGAGFFSAIALYESLGFRHIPPYRPTTWEDVACMEVSL